MRIAFAFLICLGLLTAAPVLAQYPSKPIRMVVPFPAGGSVDAVGRWVSQKLAEAWKQPVLVDNRAGAGGNVGADVVAKSAPDGYTVLLTTPGLAISPSIYKKLPFDPLHDFAPVSQLTDTFLILVVNTNVPANSVSELIALARAQPGRLNYGSSGSGARPRLSPRRLRVVVATRHLRV